MPPQQQPLPEPPRGLWPNMTGLWPTTAPWTSHLSPAGRPHCTDATSTGEHLLQTILPLRAWFHAATRADLASDTNSRTRPAGPQLSGNGAVPKRKHHTVRSSSCGQFFGVTRRMALLALLARTLVCSCTMPFLSRVPRSQDRAVLKQMSMSFAIHSNACAQCPLCEYQMSRHTG